MKRFGQGKKGTGKTMFSQFCLHKNYNDHKDINMAIKDYVV